MDSGPQRFLVSIFAAGLAGLIGTVAALMFIGGSREATVWDSLTLVQWGGLPTAAATYWLCARHLLLKVLSPLVVVPLFIGVQLSMRPFFRQVVRSDLTGNQGAIIVVAVLILTALAVTWRASALPSRLQSARALAPESDDD